MILYSGKEKKRRLREGRKERRGKVKEKKRLYLCNIGKKNKRAPGGKKREKRRRRKGGGISTSEDEYSDSAFPVKTPENLKVKNKSIEKNSWSNEEKKLILA